MREAQVRLAGRALEFRATGTTTVLATVAISRRLRRIAAATADSIRRTETRALASRRSTTARPTTAGSVHSLRLRAAKRVAGRAAKAVAIGTVPRPVRRASADIRKVRAAARPRVRSLICISRSCEARLTAEATAAAATATADTAAPAARQAMVAHEVRAMVAHALPATAEDTPAAAAEAIPVAVIPAVAGIPVPDTLVAATADIANREGLSAKGCFIFLFWQVDVKTK
jgi:hypothetical protein